MNVSVHVTGDREIISKLSALGPKLMEFSAAFAILGRELSNYYSSKAFASQGGVFGNSWQQLSPVYAARKGREFPGRGILVATGKMQQGFNFNVTPDTLVIGNDTPYFKYHQSTEPRSKMPRRPMLGVNAEVKAIVTTVIQADVQSKIRAAM